MRAGRWIVTCGMVAWALLPAAAPAAATYDPLAGGSARLSFDPSFSALLKEAGVRLVARKGAEAEGRKGAMLPVVSGRVEPRSGQGRIELGGELLLVAGPKKVPLKRLRLENKSTPLTARVGGGQQKLASATTRRSARRGFATVFSARGLRLSAKTATRLNKRLDLEVFEAGQLIGSIRATAHPATVAILPQGSAELTLDPAFAAKLGRYFVAVNPIFPAERNGGSFLLPIADEGAISPSASAGVLRTVGSLELLQLGGGQIFWQDLRFDLATATATAEVNVQPSPPYAGRQGRIAVWSIDPANAAKTNDPEARTVTVQGMPLALLPETARSFNQAFAAGEEAFHPGETLGQLTLTAQAH